MMPTPLRHFLAFVDWLREQVSLTVSVDVAGERGFSFRAGSFRLDGDRDGWGMDGPLGLFVSPGRLDDDDEDEEFADVGESSARLLCDHQLFELVVDAVERGRNGDNPREVAAEVIRGMEMDEVEMAVEEGSEP